MHQRINLTGIFDEALLLAAQDTDENVVMHETFVSPDDYKAGLTKGNRDVSLSLHPFILPIIQVLHELNLKCCKIELKHLHILQRPVPIRLWEMQKMDAARPQSLQTFVY